MFLDELGFKRSAIDHSVYYRRRGEEHTIIAVATSDVPAPASGQKPGQAGPCAWPEAAFGPAYDF